MSNFAGGENLSFSVHSDAALTWVCRSVEATGGQGSAHSFSPLWGWAKAYPETTGYLIPTLLRYAEKKQSAELRQLAIRCGHWLCGVQLASGAFPGGMAGKTRPSTFNTAMILSGLAILVRETLTEENNAMFRQAAQKALDWLLEHLDTDGSWKMAAYVPGFVPAYYTRAVWGVLEVGEALQRPDARESMRLALQYYAGRFRTDGTVVGWGFRPGQWAFSHTIAYTLEGFLEGSVRLANKVLLDQTLRAGAALLGAYRRAGQIAGRYGCGWKGDYRFRCLPGDAQTSVFFYRLWQITGEAHFRQAAQDVLAGVLAFQKLGKNPNTHGALPGSAPFWGPYLRFRYPNWGAKFLLDAIAPFLPG